MNQETEDELYRIFNTMERDDLIDFLVSNYNQEEAEAFIAQWKLEE